MSSSEVHYATVSGAIVRLVWLRRGWQAALATAWDHIGAQAAKVLPRAPRVNAAGYRITNACCDLAVRVECSCSEATQCPVHGARCSTRFSHG